MNSNDFTPFATGVGANVLAPATWAADPAKTAGFSAGIAPSVKLNTAWRQSTFVSAMIAQFTADFGPGNVVDNGNLAAFEAQFEAALNAYLAGFFQKIVISNTTFFVNNSTGNDTTGDGLTSGTAWATIAHAIKVISTFNLGGNTVTIQLGLTGVAYPGPLQFFAPSNGTLIILGNTAAQASYVIQAAPGLGNAVLSISSGSVQIKGVTVQNTNANGAGILSQNSQVLLQNVSLQTTVSGSQSLLSVSSGGSILVQAGCIMSGNANAMWQAQNGGSIIQAANCATASSPTYAGGVMVASTNGNIGVSTTGLSWTGTGATGGKGTATLCGVINSAGSPSFWPGVAAVTTATGGQSA
jgi:hypothetical protein